MSKCRLFPCGRFVFRNLARVFLSLACASLLSGCPGKDEPPRLVSSVTLQLVADGLTSPLGMAAPADGTGRLLIADQVGVIRVIDGDGNVAGTPFLDLRDKIVPLSEVYDERGLLGLALHPDYVTNGRFFVRYSAPREGQPGEDCLTDTFITGCHAEILAEFRVSDGDPNLADPESEVILLSVDKPQFNHNGGDIAFGPDGFLYISLGDGGGADDVGSGHTPNLGNGQDPTKLLGKILRIDVDGDRPYAIPNDNPFVDDFAKRAEIWALGFRNPWRLSFDRGGTHELFVADVGQNLFEEVNIVAPGGNFGWRIREGAHCFDPNAPSTVGTECALVDADGNALLDPVIEYPHLAADRAVGIAVIGGFVYRGTALPELTGNYVFGDYATGFSAPDGTLFSAVPDGDTWSFAEVTVGGAEAAAGRIGRFVLGFGEDSEGELYVLTRREGGPTGNTGAVLKFVGAAQ